MGSAPDQTTSPRARSRIPTAPSVDHSFTACGASSPLPQQAARPPAAPPAKALVAPHHPLSLTRPTATASRPHCRPLYTRSLVAATAGSRRSASVFSLQAQKSLGAELHRSEPYSLLRLRPSQQPPNNAVGTWPPDQGTGEPGAAVRPDRRLAPRHVRCPTGVFSSRGREHNQPFAPKDPQGSSTLNSSAQPLARPGCASPNPRRALAKPAGTAGKKHRRVAVRNDCRSGPPLIPPDKWRRRRRKRLRPCQSSTVRTPAARARSSPTRHATRQAASTALLHNATASTNYFKRRRSSSNIGAPPLYRHRSSSVLNGEMIKKAPCLSGASQSAGHLADWLAPPPWTRGSTMGSTGS
ncbi:hypothetical protein NDU88_008061 [Pleurodeles waltl]|uniref:Uncharacterized protein n=1 Tax=Pleurodeles waltl TaxID=8319 RepID=A0AAV7RR87_PLEWA|nr:hypothetical protein NDU88_008061 [Pleurodeles waltl]